MAMTDTQTCVVRTKKVPEKLQKSVFYSLTSEMQVHQKAYATTDRIYIVVRARLLKQIVCST